MERSRKRRGARGPVTTVAVTGLVAVAVLACYAPTGLELRIDTDECARAGETFQTAIYVGGARVDDAPRTVTSDCNPGASPKIGTLTLVPDGDRSAQVRVEVVLAVNADPDDCRANAVPVDAPSSGPRRGCVVQKRRLGFRKHEMRSVGIALNQAKCFNVQCAEGTTCSSLGTCVSDECRDGTCEEAVPPVVLPVDGGGVDGAVPLDAQAPGTGIVYAGGGDIVAGLHHASDSILVFGEAATNLAPAMVSYDLGTSAPKERVSLPNLVQVLASPEEPDTRLALSGKNGAYELRVAKMNGSPTITSFVGGDPQLVRALGGYATVYFDPSTQKGVFAPLASATTVIKGKPFAAAGDAGLLAYLSVAVAGTSSDPSGDVYTLDPSNANDQIQLRAPVGAPITYASSTIHAARGTVLVSMRGGAVAESDLGAPIRALYALGTEVYFVTDVAVGKIAPVPGSAVAVNVVPVILAARTRPKTASFLTVTSSSAYWTEGPEIHAIAR